ncbi:efflux transporter outer membrane subunit [Aquabacterium sp.]|uniref:efflux transporter outer membrane subunit n=1 Tax=Aquabacterium sp. TaxID=1872578 RepID=UPI003782DADB
MSQPLRLTSFRRAPLVLACALALLAGCAPLPEAPAAPDIASPAHFKQTVPGWMQAAPADALARGPWWQLFQDPVLDALVPRVAVSNQNVAAAAAAFAQAQALVREQRASLLPVVGATVSANRSGGGGDTRTTSRYQLGLAGSWEADLWGKLRGTVGAAEARAQASAADLAAATLSAQAELVGDYLSLRETEVEVGLLRTTITAYERSLRITRNRYEAGIAQRSDVLQAQTQLANAQADLAGLERQRAQLEHAMAVLVGQAPADFTVADASAVAAVPAIPTGLPAELLQRRPDIAAAARRVTAANASIGIAQAAYFPSLNLSASGGAGAARLSDLFNASAFTWSLGVAVAQGLFDGGARSARVDEAKAAWEQSVAQYRQTVLAAFQDVEDQLAAVRVLEQQEALRRQASTAADQTEQQVLNRYNAGQVGYTEVVAAQVSALNARRALAQVLASRQAAAVGLIRALGGGWRAPS